MFDYIGIFNGVRQGEILSPKLSFVYVEDLSDKLINGKIICQIDHLCMIHVIVVEQGCHTMSLTDECE